MVLFSSNKRPALIIRFDATGESYDVDCTMSIDPQRSSSITKHPTSRGTRFGDHRVKDPRTVTVTGVISDIHYKRGASILNPGGIVNALTENDYHKRFRERIIEADDNDEPVTVDCGERGIWSGYYFTNVSMPSDPQHGKAVNFTFSFEQNITVDSKTQNLLADRLNKAQLVAREDFRPENKIQGATPVKNGATAQRWMAGRNRGLVGTQTASSGASDIMGSVISNPGF